MGTIKKYKILAFDPGIGNTGWSLLEGNTANGNLIVLKVGEFHPGPTSGLARYREVVEKFDKLISAETRYYFFEMVYDVCLFTDITVEAKSDIRDPKDLYLLSMAESVPVDYIVSGDKDLTDLGEHE